MAVDGGQRRRSSVQITEARAARLHRLVRNLATAVQTRQELLDDLGIGLRTFYRELEFLRRRGIGVRLTARKYTMTTTVERAENSLPFPDPRLSFAEMRELAQGTSPAAQRLSRLLGRVLAMPAGKKRGKSKGSKTRGERHKAN